MAEKSIPLLFGPYGANALADAGRLAASDANAVWFHGFDETAFDRCTRYRLAACVEFKTFRADFNQHPELIPTGSDGKPIRYGKLVQGVCLSRQDFHAEIETRLADGLKRYRPRGIWLDYLSYAGWFETPEPDLQEHCFCPACIAAFCEDQNLDADRPDVILERYAARWQTYKCRRIAAFAARYAALIRTAQPDCLIGIYLCPWTPAEHGGALTRIFAQDPALLAASVDVFTPLIYTTKSGRAPDWGKTYLETAARWLPADKPVQLILDMLDFPDSLEQTAAARRPSWGLQLFGGAQAFADPEKARVFAQAVRQIRLAAGD
ncbi:MAG: hypothetical protein GX112_12730 [Clostridiaceae bacterium]|nr:hypothetical protein [Clostridiaceae bacterium]